MFSGKQHGKAAEAVSLYTSLFGNSKILEIERYGPGGTDTDGSVRMARFSLNGTEFMAIDSAIPHAFTFTPSMSLFVECDSETEIQSAFETLADRGEVLMPLTDPGFSKRFGWVQDRYGVSWQLNLL